MTLEELLNKQKERELEQLEYKKAALEDRYAQLPLIVNKVAQDLGVSSEQLVGACGRAAFHFQGMEWYDLLEIVRDVHLQLQRADI